MPEAVTCGRCSLALTEPVNYCPRCGNDLRGLGTSSDTFSGPALGKLIDNRYRLLEKLGEGGMGAVFKVEHVRMGKVMALKLLRRDLAQDKRVVERFEQEARIVSKLSHPNTVGVFDFGEVPDLGLFMAMEFVPGKDLASLLREDKAFPERRAVGIAIQVLHSLGEAHDAGIVHRDIKPGNVMLLRTRQGADFVKVLDFGIAKLAGGGGERPKAITGIADFVGTPNYVSPEQARGDALDARSDLYSLSAMLFELVSGRPPFEAPSAMGVVAKHLEAPPPHAQKTAPEACLSDAFDVAVHRGLSKERDARFQSADDMRRAFEAVARRFSDPIVLPTAAFSDEVSVDRAIALRTDWDAFEQALRRAARRRAAIALGAVALAAAGMVWAIGRGGGEVVRVARTPILDEVEPNDTLPTANLIRPGDEVRGTVGKRRSESVSDQDHFLFDVDGDRPRAARIQVTGIPNVNIAASLFAAEPTESGTAYRERARVDDLPVGQGPEVMSDLLLAPGRYLVRVQDVRRGLDDPLGAPRENSYDRYVLTVELSDADPFGEAEPNNTPEDLIGPPLAVTRPVFGHAGRPAVRDTVPGAVAPVWSDDHFRFAVSTGAGRACAFLGGVSNARLRLSLVAVDGAGASSSRIRPAAADAGDVAVRCAPAKTSLLVRVDLASGAQDREAYALAVVDDGAAGLGGGLAAADALAERGREPLARALLERTLREMPQAAGSVAARERLSTGFAAAMK